MLTYVSKEKISYPETYYFVVEYLCFQKIFSLGVCMIIFVARKLGEIVHDLPHSLLKTLQFPSLNIILN